MFYIIISSENTNNDIFLYDNIEQKKKKHWAKIQKLKKKKSWVIIEITHQFFNKKNDHEQLHVPIKVSDIYVT